MLSFLEGKISTEIIWNPSVGEELIYSIIFVYYIMMDSLIFILYFRLNSSTTVIITLQFSFAS